MGVAVVVGVVVGVGMVVRHDGWRECGGETKEGMLEVFTDEGVRPKCLSHVVD